MTKCREHNLTFSDDDSLKRAEDERLRIRNRDFSQSGQTPRSLIEPLSITARIKAFLHIG